MDTKGSKQKRKDKTKKYKDKKRKKKQKKREKTKKGNRKIKQKSVGRKAVRWEDLEQQADFRANTRLTLCRGDFFYQYLYYNMRTSTSIT